MLLLPKQKYAVRYKQGILLKKKKTSQLTNKYTPSTNFIFEVLILVLLETSVISCCAEGHIVKQSYNMALLGQSGHVYEGTMLL